MFITNKNITESLVRSLQHSFSSQTNCEITLMCEGKTIKCHRHVLVLHSSHFSDLFKDQTNFPTAVAVVNMKYIHLKAMVDYMYFGKIKLQENSEEMKQIIKCAGDLGLTALVNFIDEYIKNYSKIKQNQVNGGNLSNSELNGDIDSASKRKRASDATARVHVENFKKPKMTDNPLNQSTPLRDNSKSILKSNSTEAKSLSSLDNSETLINEKKRKSDDDEADDEESKTKRAKEKEEADEEERKRKVKEEEAKKKLKQDEEERKQREEEENKRKAEEKQKLEAERRKKAEEEKRIAAEDAKRKAEEEEKIRVEEEKKKKEAEKKKEEQAKKVEEEKNKKETTKCDESASTKSCAVCNKQYKDNIDHRKVLDGVQFEKKCIMANCSKPLKFRRSLIDHLLKEHKIDVCDG